MTALSGLDYNHNYLCRTERKLQSCGKNFTRPHLDERNEE